MTNRAVRTLAAVAICLMFHVVAEGQAERVGRIAGTVRDSTGAVLPGVTLTLAGEAPGSRRTAVTDEHGRYAIDSLPRGTYVLDTALAGFERRVLHIDVDGAHTQDIVLTLSSLSETLTVTADRTGRDDIQKTPMAISAVASTTLDQLNIRSIERLAGLMPGLTITHSPGGHVLPAVRGIGTNAAVAGADPSSTVYLDGVYLSRPAMTSVDLLDVERIEVLRGPQGTLYGRNAVGGAIHILTRQPTNALETQVRLTAGNHAHLRAEGAIRGPIVVNRVMASLAVLRSARDGFVEDLDHREHPLGSEDTWAGRGQLRIVFGSGGELLLSADYGRFAGAPLTYAKPLHAKPGFDFSSPPSLWEVRTSHLASGRNIQRGASARLVLHVDESTTLTSLTAYRTTDDRFFIDRDATELPLLTVEVPDDQRQLSQELILARRRPNVTWIAGAIGFGDHNEGPVEITDVRAGVQNRPFFASRARAWAAFAQGSYDLSRRMVLTTGLRFSRERKAAHNRGGVYRSGTSILARPDSFYDFRDAATFRAWTPRVALGVRPRVDTYVYVSAARGFKSGGFNPTATRAAGAFRPEFAWSYEAGIKQTTAAGRLRTNVAAFFNDYRDLQVQALIETGVIDIRNAASAAIHGIEAEATLSARRLRLAGAASWLRATYDRYVAVGSGNVVADAAGHRLNNAPEWSGSGSAAYETAAGRRVLVNARVDVSWQSRVFFTPFNDMLESQRGYALVHLRAGLAPRSGRWRLDVYGRNVRNTAYVTGTLTNLQLPAINARPGEPRQWGTQLTFRR